MEISCIYTEKFIENKTLNYNLSCGSELNQNSIELITPPLFVPGIKVGEKFVMVYSIWSSEFDFDKNVLLSNCSHSSLSSLGVVGLDRLVRKELAPCL